MILTHSTQSGEAPSTGPSYELKPALRATSGPTGTRAAKSGFDPTDGTVLPRTAREFTCQTCFLICSAPQLADPASQTCRGCV